MKIISSIAYIAAISILGYATFKIAFYDGIQGGSDYLILAGFFAMTSQFAFGVYQGIQQQQAITQEQQDLLQLQLAELNQAAKNTMNQNKDLN